MQLRPFLTWSLNKNRFRQENYKKKQSKTLKLIEASKFPLKKKIAYFPKSEGIAIFMKQVSRWREKEVRVNRKGNISLFEILICLLI